MFKILSILLIFLLSTEAFPIVEKRTSDEANNEPRRSKRHTSSATVDELTADEIMALEQAEEAHARTRTDFQHISGPTVHRKLLMKAIKSAKNTLLITSESIGFLPGDIYYALKDAKERGVTIMIYYNQKIPYRTLNFLKGISKIEKRNIHAKYLIFDDSSITIGSHNWLDFTHSHNINRSFQIANNSPYVRELRLKINKQIMEYGNIMHAQETSATSVARSLTATQPITYALNANGTSTFTLLNSLGAHNQFLMEIANKAERRIDITSPFVNFRNAIARLEWLANRINPNVIVHLHVWDRPSARELRNAINKHLSLQGQFQLDFLPDNAHNKTLIMDDTLIAEGSFNWLSSALTEESLGHNLDSTIVLEGPAATRIIAADEEES